MSALVGIIKVTLRSARYNNRDQTGSSRYNVRERKERVCMQHKTEYLMMAMQHRSISYSLTLNNCNNSVIIDLFCTLPSYLMSQ